MSVLRRRRLSAGASASQCWGVGVSMLGRRRLSAGASASQRGGVERPSVEASACERQVEKSAPKGRVEEVYSKVQLTSLGVSVKQRGAREFRRTQARLCD